VILLHGLASSANWYDLVAPHLRNDYRVIAPDQRGHGQTTQAGSGYDWGTLTKDVVGLMDELALAKAAVFGHSWGANVALNVAARAPDRVYALGLIDGGTSRGSGARESWEEVRARARPRNISGTREEFLDRLRTQLSFCWSDQVERIVQTMVYEDGEGAMQDILRPENHIQVMRAMWEEPASLAYPNILCPTVIIPAGPAPQQTGSERALVKQERVAAAEQAIKNSRVRWIPETVHDIGYHKPEELAQVIREFLDESFQSSV
jgi:pimeloyl-ACP methyl ester carboxylesterase